MSSRKSKSSNLIQPDYISQVSVYIFINLKACYHVKGIRETVIFLTWILPFLCMKNYTFHCQGESVFAAS